MDPVTPLLFGLAVILVCAKIGGDLAVRAGQPAVLGELVSGVLIGNLGALGVELFEPVKASALIDGLAKLGVILLLFQVGLESTVSQMLGVGRSALAVAVLGVAAPMALGWGVGALVLPGHGTYVHIFLGATLTATSVGITARVLRDLGRATSAEGRIILGAAVIDDVLGLVILAVVAGLIQAADSGAAASGWALALILAKAVGFLAVALGLGGVVAPLVFRLAERLRSEDVLLGTALAFCFAFAYAASRVDLAPIVGAYAAGLVLEPVHYQGLRARGEHDLEELVHPIASFLVPVFFVLMGTHVDLTAVARPEVLGLAPLLTLAAIAGKQACMLGVLEPGVDRLSVAIGMIPRGEVGLIFANMGLSLSVRGEKMIDQGTFSAVVLMVIVTTMITPPLLRWSLQRSRI